MDDNRSGKEIRKDMQKLKDNDMEKVSGGIFFANNTIYRQGIDDSRAGFAVMSGDTPADPVYLNDNMAGRANKKKLPLNGDKSAGDKSGWA